jgi:hypothetical protein
MRAILLGLLFITTIANTNAKTLVCVSGESSQELRLYVDQFTVDTMNKITRGNPNISVTIQKAILCKKGAWLCVTGQKLIHLRALSCPKEKLTANESCDPESDNCAANIVWLPDEGREPD